MPINPNIPLASRAADLSGLGASLLQGQTLKDRKDTAPIRNKLLEQRAVMQEQTLKSNDVAMANAESQKKVMAGYYTHEAMKQWRQLPPERRAASVDAFGKFMRDAGLMTPEDTFADDPIDSDEWLDSSIAATAPFAQMYNKGRGGFQKGATAGLYKDTKGNMFQANSTFDEKTGTFIPSLTPANPYGAQQPVGQVQPVNSSGLTSPEALAENVTKTTDTTQIGIRQGIAKDAFESIGKANAAIANIDSALKAIDDGANTGPIDQWFPSFKTSTVELQNAANRMGLDIIGAVTFGALSAGEMRLAMSTALPMNLEPPQLKKWLGDRKRAQHKLRAEMMKAAQHFESNGSIGDYLDSMKVKGEYISRADLPMITTQQGFDSLKPGANYLTTDDAGNVVVGQK